MIGIVDIGLCNLRSISKAIYSLGFDFELVSRPEALASASHCVLPGVGAFRTAMERLEATGMVEALRAFARSSKPVLGICLGMQLLAARGEEGGESGGLSLVPGTVKRLGPHQRFRVPHVGWNTVKLTRPHALFEGVKPQRDFYFVHSYHLHADEADSVLAETSHGHTFVSAVARGNVVGVQFHPEKSQSNGLRLLENFCNWGA